MKFSYTKNPESEFFCKESKYNKNNFGGWEGMVWGVARESDFFLFSKESKSEKKSFLFEGVKVRESEFVLQRIQI